MVERRLRDSMIFKAFGDAAAKLPTPARAAIRDDDELMPFIQLSSMNDNGGIIFTDGPKRGYFPDEGVFVSAGHLDPSRDGDGGKYLRTELREAFALDISIEDEIVGTTGA